MQLAVHRKSSRRARLHGFTLVELGTVIAIAVLLAALLLPALSSAKEKSCRAVCKSNIRGIIHALYMYGGDNADYLPTSSDNSGYYHSIRLSDMTYSNIVGYLSGVTNTLYCPNITFGNPPTQQGHDANGFIIGYSYLAAANIQASVKGPDYWVAPQKLTDNNGTTAIVADANYWTHDSSNTKVAPHAKMGTTTSNGSSFTTGLPGANSAAIGAVGGNVGYLNGSVLWRTLGVMQEYQASSDSSAFGNW